MLFKDFLWQDFLLAATLLAVLWYAGVWLLCYRKKNGSENTSLPHRWQDKVDELDGDLMGRPVAEPGTELLSSEDFGFAENDPIGQLGPVADVQQDIKVACHELEAGLATKEAYLERFGEIIGSYRLSEHLKEGLADFVRENVPFFIEQEELERIGL